MGLEGTNTGSHSCWVRIQMFETRLALVKRLTSVKRNGTALLERQGPCTSMFVVVNGLGLLRTLRGCLKGAVQRDRESPFVLWKCAGVASPLRHRRHVLIFWAP